MKTNTQPQHHITQQELPTASSLSSNTFLIDSHCRICLESEPGLMQPCSCRGTVRYVHQHCLKLWIQRKQQMLYLQSLSTQPRSIECELCLRQIYYNAKSSRSMSIDELKLRIEKFPQFFAVHTVILVMLAIFIALLTYLLQRVVKREDQWQEKVPSLVIEGTLLFLIVLTFMKSLQLWIDDYLVRENIVVTKIIPYEQLTKIHIQWPTVY